MSRTPRDCEIARVFTTRIWVAARLGRRSYGDLAHIIEHMHWERGSRPHLSSERARRMARDRIAQQRRDSGGRFSVAGPAAPQGD